MQAILSKQMPINHKGQQQDLSLDNFLTALQDGVIVLDAEQKIAQINPAARKIFALNEINCSGQLLTDVIKLPELEKVIVQVDEPSLRNHHLDIAIGENSLYSTAAVRLDGGAIAITLHDVSHWGRLDRSKHDFISSISHDIRSPLTSIMGYADLIDRVGSVNDQQRSFIERIQINTANIVHFLGDLVKLDQVETEPHASREQLGLLDLVDEAARDLSNKIKAKNLHLEVDFGNSDQMILANRRQMVQALSCLLDNAIKFSPPEEVVGVIAKTIEQQIILEISNTGIGIPALEMAHIFERFYRGSNISETEPGNGLGLTIARTVIDHHAGRLWIDSSSDGGTQATIVLPSHGS